MTITPFKKKKKVILYTVVEDLFLQINTDLCVHDLADANTVIN